MKTHRTFQGMNKVSGQFIYLNRVASIEFIPFVMQNKKHFKFIVKEIAAKLKNENGTKRKKFKAT